MKKLTVSNTGTNIKFVLLLLFFCFFFSKESHSQVLTQKDGIPMILFTEGPPDIPQNEVIKMKNLGVDIIQHSNVEDYMIERFVQNGLKVMPYHTWEPNNYIYQYTNAHYTEWEAEGTAPDKGNVTLERNSSISEFYFEDNTLKGIKTMLNAEAGNLIKGPGYRQTGHERYNDERPIIYDADFILKINSTDPNINLFEPEYQETVVCSIKVVSHGVSFDVTNDTMFISENPASTFWREIKIKHFTNYDWNHLIISGYDWQEGGIPTLHPTEEEYFPTWKEPIYYEGQYVQFIVDWAGSNLLQLSVDKIVVSDQDGRNLMNPAMGTDLLIASEVNSYTNPDAIEIFYSADEPTSIDNYEPYRVVDNMVQAATNNTKRIITSLNTYYNGRYGTCQSGSYKYYIAEEFWKRATPMFLWLNAFPYHYYYKPGEHPNWQEENINLQIEKIKNVSENDPNWGQDIQCTKWTLFNKNCIENDFLISPTVEMMSYSTNLALLFGAKKIGFYEYYSLKNTTCNVWYADGLVDQNGVPNSRYYKIKDDIAPALNGLFGKTLKNTTPTEQFVNLNLTSPLPVVNYSFIQKIEAINYSEATNMFLDLGFFTESIPQDKYYSIGVNRWYSTVNEMKYTFQNPNPGYNNYRVMNLQDTTSTYIDFANDNKYLTTYLEFGDAHFI